MRLQEYFIDKENYISSQDVGTVKHTNSESNWTPEEGRDRWLDEYIRQVKEDFINGLDRKFSSNITSSDDKTMRELLHDHCKIIRPADKGSEKQVMDTYQYVDQLESEMINSASCNEVKEDRSKRITNKIKKLVKQHAEKRIHHVWVMTLSFTYRNIFRETRQIYIFRRIIIHLEQ